MNQQSVSHVECHIQTYTYTRMVNILYTAAPKIRARILTHYNNRRLISLPTGPVTYIDCKHVFIAEYGADQDTIYSVEIL